MGREGREVEGARQVCRDKMILETHPTERGRKISQGSYEGSLGVINSVKLQGKAASRKSRQYKPKK